MNEDEIIRKKYRNLRSNIYSIRYKLSNLTDSYNDMFANLKEGIDIDGDIPNEDVLREVKKDINNIASEINYNLLPKINRKT